MFRLLFLAVLAFGTVWIYTIPVPHQLTVSFLDVGQGDAIFIEGPTGTQLLIDGGATRGVLRSVRKVMPFFDRSIDAVVATHPDQDHIGGLAHVLGRYAVQHFFEPGNSSQTPASLRLREALQEKGMKPIPARRGMRLLLGGGAYADVLFPDRDVSTAESNTASVVMRVVYGETAFLLTGDSPQSIEKYLVSLEPLASGKSGLKSNVLKAGHHGSKTSSAEIFLETVNPDVVVISAGKDNRYGHPHQTVVEAIKSRGIGLRSTALEGTVLFTSNGETISIQ